MATFWSAPILPPFLCAYSPSNELLMTMDDRERHALLNLRISKILCPWRSTFYLQETDTRKINFQLTDWSTRSLTIFPLKSSIDVIANATPNRHVSGIVKFYVLYVFIESKRKVWIATHNRGIVFVLYKPPVQRSTVEVSSIVVTPNQSCINFV